MMLHASAPASAQARSKFEEEKEEDEDCADAAKGSALAGIMEGDKLANRVTRA